MVEINTVQYSSELSHCFQQKSVTILPIQCSSFVDSFSNHSYEEEVPRDSFKEELCSAEFARMNLTSREEA